MSNYEHWRSLISGPTYLPDNAPPGTWSSSNLTYSYFPSRPGYVPATTEYNPITNETLKSVVDAIFAPSTTFAATFSDVTPLKFQLVTTVGDLNIATGTDSNVAGYAYYPGTRGPLAGDVWLSALYQQGTFSTAQAREDALHEIGHALGLTHVATVENVMQGYRTEPHTNPLPAAENFTRYSVMSYVKDIQNVNMNPQGLMLYDIAALQELYGVNTKTRNSDTTYTFNESRDFFSIWDGGGEDTLSAQGSLIKATIDLRQGEFSSINFSAGPNDPAVNNISIAFGAKIENAIGSDHADTIIGNQLNNILIGGKGDDQLFGDGIAYATENGLSARSGYYDGSYDYNQGGNDTIYGGDGNDKIFGGGGQGYLFGGSGNDIINGRALDVLTPLQEIPEVPQKKGDINTDTKFADHIFGGDGDDTMYGGEGADSLDGGEGVDSFFGGAGSDKIEGEFGEYFAGGAGNDSINLRSENATGTATIAFGRGDGHDVVTQSFDIYENEYIDAGNIDIVFEDLTSADLEFVAERHLSYVDYGAWGGGTGIVESGATFYSSYIRVSGTDDVLVFRTRLGTSSFTYEDNEPPQEIEEEGMYINVRFIFADGEIWTNEQIIEHFQAQNDAISIHNQDPFSSNYGTVSKVTGWEQGAPSEYLTARQDYQREVDEESEDDPTAIGTGAPIAGTSGDDTLSGGSDDEILAGGAGADTLDGGEGRDSATYAQSVSAVTIDLENGTGSGGDAAGDVLSNIENVIGSQYGDTLIGDSADNELYGAAGDDTLRGGFGYDTLNGGEGSDIADYSTAIEGIAVSLASGVGTYGDAEGDRLLSIEAVIGSNYNDTLAGGHSSETLFGGDGDDLLIGSAAPDTLYGGADVDLVDYSISTLAVTIDLTSGSGSGGYAAGDTLVDIENVRGSKGADILIGDSGENFLDGHGGNDTLEGNGDADRLFGGSGDDLLDGGDGADSLDGGSGNDIAAYASSTSGVSVNLTTGSGTGGFAQGDTFDSIEGVIGSAYSDTLTGNSTANYLSGGAGADTLYGGSGNDTLVGGAAGDRLEGGSDSDTADYSQSSGAVTINLGSGTAAGGDAQGDTLVSIENLIGSVGGDTLIGSGGANIIHGGDGDDIIDGSGGNDTLAGGAGSDSIIGDSGTDIIDYSSSDDGVTVDLSLGSASGGHAQGDTYSGIEGLIGSTHSDTLRGDSAANLLIGLAGNDVLAGNAGGDSLVGGDGIDTADYAASSSGVTIDLFAGTATGGDASGDTLISIENLVGSSSADSLFGDDEANRLSGGGGGDTLSGENGDDVLIGGTGGDTLYGGAGTDIADYSSSSASIEIDLEAGTGSGGDAQDDIIQDVEGIVGSAYSDTITGSAADEIFEGLGGADTFYGGDGEDTATYSQSSAAVTVDLSTGMGTGGHAEADVLVDIENLRGSSHNDRLIGNDASNVLLGADGNDTLEGKAGADTLIGGAGADTADYGTSSSAVSVNLYTYSFAGGDAEGDLLLEIENVAGSINDDFLAGNDQTNVLFGGIGSDTLRGGRGADSLYGGIGADTIEYSTSNAGVRISLALGIARSGDASEDVFSDIENVVGSQAGDWIEGDIATNVLVGLAGDDALFGGGGDDTLIGGSGADYFNGGAGKDRVDYSGSLTAIYVDLQAASGEIGEAWGDSFVSIERVTGSNFGDTLVGAASTDQLSGAGGDDLIFAGDDNHISIFGGGGNDYVVAGDGANVIFGGSGSDIVDYSASNAPISVNLSTQTIVGGFGDDDSLMEIEGIVGTSSDDELIGNAADNTFFGLSGEDTLYGGSGNDLLHGGEGDDLLIGGSGADILDGASGINTADYSSSGQGVHIDLVTGEGQGGDAEGDILFGINRLIGSSHSDTLVGSFDNEEFYGGDGSDTLDGGDGNDLLVGGAAGDSLIGGEDYDIADYSASAAAVTIDLSNGTGVGGDAQGDTLSEIEGVRGSSQGDSLIGSDGDNLIAGGAGGDVISGLDGDDLLIGGADADTLYGGAGNDIADYSDSAAAVTIDLDAGTGVGGDAQSDVLDGIEGAIGSAHNDTLIGNSSENQLFGGDGDDVLDGADDDDLLIGGAGEDSLIGGAGDDTASYIYSAAAISVSLDTGLGTGGDADGDTLTSIEGLVGSIFDDTLIGNSSANFLHGFDGDDTLVGGAGADTLDGGYGFDAVDYSASSAAVSVSLAAGTAAGGDAQDDTLASIEVVIGSTYADTIIGSDRDEILDGAAGDDTLSGGAGDDLLVGSAGADSLIGGDGFDYVDYSDSATAVYVDLSLGSGSGGDAQGDTLDEVEGVIGSAGDDTIIGDNSDNVIIGGDGADTLIGGAGTDHVSYILSASAVTVDLSLGTGSGGQAQGDILDGFEGVIGSEFDDSIIGDAEANYIFGGQGNDTLEGGIGGDTLNGGAGIDTVSYQSSGSGVTVDLSLELASDGDAEGDVIEQVENLIGSDYADSLVGTWGANFLQGGAGDDTLAGLEANDTLVGGLGSDTLDGGGGFDIVDYSTEDGAIILDLASGSSGGNAAGDILINIEQVNGTDYNDSITGNYSNEILLGLAGNDFLDGRRGHDHILGGDGDDTLLGQQGDDTLDGGDGVDTLVGGTGNDLYVIDDAGDVIVENDGEGIDTVHSAVSIALGAYIENLVLLEGASITATGNSLANSMVGNSSSNVIFGGAGNDFLDGGEDADTLIGGIGDDIYVIDDLADVVVEDANEGIDTVRASVSYQLGANVEHLILLGADNLTATGNSLSNAITGNDGDNIINGGIGNDLLDGGAGADTLIGGDGDDVYGIDNVLDVVIEDGASGTDTVVSSVSYTLSANLENLTLTGEENIDGTGNATTNIIVGNIGNNYLYGADGNDTLIGGSGNDTLIGGEGLDTLIGERGADWYVLDDIDDVVIEGDGDQDDTIEVAFSYSLGSDIENLFLAGTSSIDGTGNASNNTIVGNSGNNTLLGLDGDDVLDGGGGADYLDGGAGINTVSVEFGNFASNLNLETETGSGGLTFTNIHNLRGSSFGDTLIGDAQDNVLEGRGGDDTILAGAGNDTLFGGLGADTLQGNEGDDLYDVDDGGDVLIEDLNEGTDTVLASINYELAANIENLFLVGDAELEGTGNSLSNTIVGNSASNLISGGDGNDFLDGGADADVLIGGDGDDTYIVDHEDDLLLESVAEGNDTVLAYVNYSLSENIENLVLSGLDGIHGTGNSISNIITGNSSDNSLNGGAGNDTLYGGEGNDTLNGEEGIDTQVGGLGDDHYVLDDLSDVVLEGVDEGIDTVHVAFSYALGSNVENLILTGALAINGTGNALDNQLVGNDDENTLIGGDGNDTIWGADGNDDLRGGDGDDILDGGVGADTLDGGAGINTVSAEFTNVAVNFDLSFGTSDDGDTFTNIQNLRGSSFGDTLIGDAGANVLEGMDGDDTLIGDDGDDLLSGGLGADSMAGGEGNDTYIVDSEDIFVEYASEGVDTVETAQTHILAEHFENLTLIGTSSIDGAGNDVANVITGNVASNTLSGGAGNDTLIGNGGEDFYFFSRGDDEDRIVNGGEQDLYQTGVIGFDSDIAYDDLWFTADGDDLVIGVLGTTDKVIVEDWYLSDAAQVTQIQAGGGSYALDTWAVDQLVYAMSDYVTNNPTFDPEQSAGMPVDSGIEDALSAWYSV